MDKEVNISQGNGKRFNSSDDEEPNTEDFKVGGRDRASESDIMGSSDAEGTISRRNKGRLTSSESESDEQASDAEDFDEKDINDDCQHCLTVSNVFFKMTSYLIYCGGRENVH